MKKIINYLKFISIFLILELAITFITSLLNLIGLSSEITSLILFIINIILFFILNYLNAKTKNKKGYLEGLTLGLLFIIIMYFIKIILFSKSINISLIIYYIILLISSILGGMFGINKNSDNK